MSQVLLSRSVLTFKDSPSTTIQRYFRSFWPLASLFADETMNDKLLCSLSRVFLKP